jgi:hypothetical protein
MAYFCACEKSMPIHTGVFDFDGEYVDRAIAEATCAV